LQTRGGCNGFFRYELLGFQGYFIMTAKLCFPTPVSTES
jgi:hypothetical protein